MAPEKNHKKMKKDPFKVDIYSIGVILYQMLYNALPTMDYSRQGQRYLF